MTYVYESPDGGETVYRRKFGSLEKELHSESKRIQHLKESFKQIELWKEILKESRTNPTLKDALDRAQLIYELGRDHY
jgi:hypothetical protein